MGDDRYGNLDIVGGYWGLLWEGRIHLHLWRATTVSAVSAVASVFRIGRMWTVMSVSPFAPLM